MIILSFLFFLFNHCQ